MSGGVVRLSDPNSCGGKPMNGITSVRVNGMPIVVNGASVTSHSNYESPHTSAKTVAGTTSVRAGGIPVVSATDVDSCGHTRLNASTNVTIG
jgi:uncharacterized Zn-binding protein involved in type VI secretion